MGDLRDFIGWLREKGHPQVGVMGMSLGGYTTSLLATLENDLAFAVPMIPLASLADFARDQGRLGSNASEQQLMYAESGTRRLRRRPHASAMSSNAPLPTIANNRFVVTGRVEPQQRQLETVLAT